MVSNPAAGIVLAGGKSQRMGTDKARLALPDGRPVILSVVEVLKSICGEVVVVTEATGRYADLALPARCVTDIAPGCGLMGGAACRPAGDRRPLRPGGGLRYAVPQPALAALHGRPPSRL